MKRIFSISSVIVRSWRNQLARLVGGNPVVLVLCGVFALVLLVLWWLTVKEFVLPLFGGFSADTNLFVAVNSLLLTNISLVAALFLGIFLMLSPPEDRAGQFAGRHADEREPEDDRVPAAAGVHSHYGDKRALRTGSLRARLW